MMAGDRLNTHHSRRSGGDRDVVAAEHAAFLSDVSVLRNACRRKNESLTILMFELNPIRGEGGSGVAGDRGCQSAWFRSVLVGLSRESDKAAHYFGDRFVLALPAAGANDARGMSERCRRSLQERPLVIDGRTCGVTLAVGIAESNCGDRETAYQLIQRARVALEQAKKRGEDSTVVWTRGSDETGSPSASCRNVANGVTRWIENLRCHLRSTCTELTQSLVAAVEAKDPYTRSHSQAVADYAVAIGRRMGLSESELQTLRDAALLHDVGKIGVPDAILTKPGPLTREEFDIVKRHPETALEILSPMSYLQDERPLILHHHERWDGTGYPSGLEGEQIPLGARILSVADALDTMLSPRTYKEPFSVGQVRRELLAVSGRQFDPAVTVETLRWFDEGIGRDVRPDLCHR